MLFVGVGLHTLIGRPRAGLCLALSVLHHLRAQFRSVVAGCNLGSSRGSPGKLHPPSLRFLTAPSLVRRARYARVTPATLHMAVKRSTLLPAANALRALSYFQRAGLEQSK